jgi:hypothetical protein
MASNRPILNVSREQATVPILGMTSLQIICNFTVSSQDTHVDNTFHTAILHNPTSASPDSKLTQTDGRSKESKTTCNKTLQLSLCLIKGYVTGFIPDEVTGFFN